LLSHRFTSARLSSLLHFVHKTLRRSARPSTVSLPTLCIRVVVAPPKAVPSGSRLSAGEATVGLPLVGPDGTLIAMSKPTLRDELRNLSLAERLEPVEELWDSIAAECEREPFPLTDEQRADLERRLAEADAEPAGGAPWEEVLERIRQRLR
jgi:putative addiction module component (TIGR02574 family)